LGNRVMGIKEGTCCGEHWVLYTTNESFNTTSKINDVLCVGLVNFVKKKKRSHI